MIVRYWNPNRETLSRQIDRLFESVLDTHEIKSHTTWTPAVELAEKTDALVLNAYLPGISADDVDVQVAKNSIMISGVRKQPELQEGDRSLYSDIKYGQFRRFIELPIAIQHTNVKASFENGILSLTLPKLEEDKNKVVKISLGNTMPQIEATETSVDSSAN